MMRQRGFTLLEVMVALILLSVGLLGLAGMQLSGLKNTSDSIYRTTASTLARDLADRMHANPLGLEMNDYAKSGISAIDCVAPPGPDCDSSGASCDAAQIAAWDLFYVYCGGVETANLKRYGIEQQIPAGTLQVFCEDLNTADANPCSTFSPQKIVISWMERAELTGKQKQKNSSSHISNDTKTRSFELIVSGRR